MDWGISRSDAQIRSWAFLIVAQQNIISSLTQTHCAYCECAFGENRRYVTKEHFIPLSKGGTNDPKNIYIACQYCNLLKSNYLPDEFIYFLAQKLRHKEYPGVNGFTFTEQLLITVKKNVYSIFCFGKPATISPKPVLKRDKRYLYYQRHAADVTLKVNPNYPTKLDPEYTLYLQSQTLEQYQLAKIHGWKIAKILTEPEPNFHEID